MRILLCSLLLLATTTAQADFSDAPQVPGLLAQLREHAGFNAAELAQVRAALKDARFLPQLIHTERNAKEKTLTWAQYRPIAVNASNIANGVTFMQTHQRWLARAQAQYGVPPAVVTAILGVETKYGTYTGHVRVLDALATMGFRHPTRGPFFLGELEQFFVLCRNDDLDPTRPKGSYAGAMGDAQFMPSNYLRLGVDFDGNGKVDLWSAPDAIGSIANYLAHFAHGDGWQRGMPLAVPARVDASLPASLKTNTRHPSTTIAALARAHVTPDDGAKFPRAMRAGLVRLNGATHAGDWIALGNFYAVMSYNPRIFYAMAVTQLAQALSQAHATADDSRTGAKG